MKFWVKNNVLKTSIMVSVAMVVVLVVLGLLMPQHERVVSTMKHILHLDNAASTKITVYQSQGQKGEVIFSDQQNAAHTARLRVVDTAKGTTIHTDVQKKEVNASAVLSFSHDNSKFQQQAQEFQHARMERAIHGE